MPNFANEKINNKNMAKDAEIKQVLSLPEGKKQKLRCIYKFCRRIQDFLAKQMRIYKIKFRNIMDEGHFNYNALRHLDEGILAPEQLFRIKLSIISILRKRDVEERMKHSSRESVKSLENEFKESCGKFIFKTTHGDIVPLIEAYTAFSREQQKGTLYRKAEILYQYEMNTK